MVLQGYPSFIEIKQKLLAIVAAPKSQKVIYEDTIRLNSMVWVILLVIDFSLQYRKT